MTTMLLAQDFPPMGGGIARLHEELARRFPPGELIVSTPADRDASEVDGAFSAGFSTPNLRPQYENPAGAAAVVAPGGEPRPQAPRALRVFRQREARRPSGALGLRAV